MLFDCSSLIFGMLTMGFYTYFTIGVIYVFLNAYSTDGLRCYVCPGADKITDCPIEECPKADTLCALGGFHDLRVYGACTDTSVCKPGPWHTNPFPPCGYCCLGDLCNNHTCFGP